LLILVIFLVFFETVMAASENQRADENFPWQQTRQLTDFQGLLNHSPFSLPSAEESSPLKERYAMTGIVTIGGAEEVFVFDRTDQSRELITRTQNAKNMTLVSVVHEGSDLPTKAVIRVGTQIGTIEFLEAQRSGPSASPASNHPNPPLPGAGIPSQVAPTASLPSSPSPAPVTAPPISSERRIIHRPIITPPSTTP
jgi:hypothetical protein